MRSFWRFIGWMAADVPGALRRSFWMAIITGFLGAVYQRITRASERLARKLGVA